jgi:diacylglycerol kinase (ATP)
LLISLLRAATIHRQNRNATNIRYAIAANSSKCEDASPAIAVKTCIILNPAAGSAENTDVLREKFVRLGSYDLEVTAEPGDARRFAQEAAENGCELIVVAGGDGTLNEVVNGIFERNSQGRVGIIPLGTGNDFARSINLPASSDDCLEVIARGQTKPIDLVRVTSDQVRYFVNVSAGGFSGLVDEKLTPEIKKTWGPLAYLRSAAAALPELRAYKTKIAFDETETIEMDLYNVIIGNGRYVAGGIPVAPEAILNDGLIDVVLIPEKPKAELAVLVAQILLGKHLASETIVYRRAAQVDVNSKPGMWFNVDGELVGNEPALFEVMPEAIKFIIGEK